MENIKKIVVGHRNRHRPQLSSKEYHGVIDGNTVNVILNPPLFAQDKDSPNYSGIKLSPL